MFSRSSSIPGGGPLDHLQPQGVVLGIELAGQRQVVVHGAGEHLVAELAEVLVHLAVTVVVAAVEEVLVVCAVLVVVGLGVGQAMARGDGRWARAAGPCRSWPRRWCRTDRTRAAVPVRAGRWTPTISPLTLPPTHRPAPHRYSWPEPPGHWAEGARAVGKVAVYWDPIRPWLVMLTCSSPTSRT